MEDSRRHRYSKQTSERSGSRDDGDGKRKSPRADAQEKIFMRKQSVSSSPRSHSDYKDNFRKVLEGHRSQERSRRERPLGDPNRWNKESWHEDEDSGRVLQESRKRKTRDKRKGDDEDDDDVGRPVIDESVMTDEELCSLRQAEEIISKEEIFRLQRQARNNPKAVYTCTLCDVLLDSIGAAYRHAREKWHKKRAKERRDQLMLAEIPPPSAAHVCVVEQCVCSEAIKLGLTEEDRQRRVRLVSSMQDIICCTMPDVTLRLYGSSWTRFGFKDADINIDVQFPPHMHQPDVLLLVQESLRHNSRFVKVESDFHARVPVIVCIEKQSGLTCRVSAGNDNAYLTSVYLSALSDLEPRVIPLVIALRHWAQICHVDRADEGGLPPYTLALMIIYFLQQRRPAVLPSYLGFWIPEFSISKLCDFHLTGVDDGCALWEFSQQEQSTQGKAPLVFGPEHHCSASVGQLWIEMLRFYSLECDIANRVISVRLSVYLSRETKDWPKKKIAIEDPFAVKRNVARTVTSQSMFEYILHCLKTSYKYFALASGPNRPKNQTEEKHSDLRSLSLGPSAANGTSQHQDCVVEEEMVDADTQSEGAHTQSERVDRRDEETSSVDELPDTRGRQHLDYLTNEDEPFEGVELHSEGEGLQFEGLDTQSQREGPLYPSVAPPSDVPRYEFKKHFFTRGKSHTIVCSLCKHEGHLKRDCPEDFKKVELDPLPPMTPKFQQILNDVCMQCFRDFAPDDIEEKVRDHILQDLEKFIRCLFEGAKLQLFGSSKNGFGFKQSDLDICMVLEGRETDEGLDCISIIDNLAKVLRKHSGLRNILPITTAKVPIVKFLHVRTGLEGDISLYNMLALHNTRLLAAYAAIDPRVKHLCYVMKVFVKMCDIGDASRGSLSSYAYTLMVLFFLQQREPPVIPVLQEIYEGPEVPQLHIDGWNVYFFEKLDELAQHWPEYGCNAESVAELWLGLLHFYTQTFDFSEHVVCVRRKQLLTTFQKQWTSKYIVIEDPFDLNHNLGAGLSRRMTNFIMKAFIRGRQVFGTPVKVFPAEYPSMMEYFFDPEVLTDGEHLPNDRCCRICGKIGHFMKDCPLRRRVRQKRDHPHHEDGGPTARRHHGEQKRERAEPWKRAELHECFGGRRQEEKRCFICGSQGHIKKDCPQHRGHKVSGSSVSDGSPSGSRYMKNVLSPQKEEKKQKVILSPKADRMMNTQKTLD